MERKVIFDRSHYGEPDLADQVCTPDTEQLMEWMRDGTSEATDGCPVETDGTCEHGCDSWLVVLSMI